jgi:hypothetical protein
LADQSPLVRDYYFSGSACRWGAPPPQRQVLATRRRRRSGDDNYPSSADFLFCLDFNASRADCLFCFDPDRGLRLLAAQHTVNLKKAGPEFTLVLAVAARRKK